MTEAKLRELWGRFSSLLASQGITLEEPEPDVERITVPGNRSDVLAYLLMARLINKLAWRATDKAGSKLSYLGLQERAAFIMPEAITLTKKAKRGELDNGGRTSPGAHGDRLGDHQAPSEAVQEQSGTQGTEQVSEEDLR